MSESDKLLHSAEEQWETVRRLVELTPMNSEARRAVVREARDSRRLLAARWRATPVERDPLAEVVECLVDTLDEIIDQRERETTAA